MDQNENDGLSDDESNDSDIYSADISLQDYESNNSESDISLQDYKSNNSESDDF